MTAATTPAEPIQHSRAIESSPISRSRMILLSTLQAKRNWRNIAEERLPYIALIRLKVWKLESQRSQRTVFLARHDFSAGIIAVCSCDWSERSEIWKNEDAAHLARRKIIRIRVIVFPLLVCLLFNPACSYLPRVLASIYGFDTSVRCCELG
jgi:hypothetical protein